MSLEVMGSAQGTYQSIRPQTSSAPVDPAPVTMPHQAVTPVAVNGVSEGQTNTDGRQQNEKGMKSAIDMANKQARFRHTNAQFAYHEDTNRISIKIIDNDTQEVIKEIPSEETLDMISKLYDLLGMVVDEKR